MMLDRDKLVSILNLLDSTNAGERANAGLAAARLVQSAGKSWDEIVMPASYDQRLSYAAALVARGWNVIPACGISMSLSPQNGSAAPNIARWTGSRWGQVLDYCGRCNNSDHTSVETQLNYLNANLRSVYNSMSVKLDKAKTAEEASKIFAPYMGNDDGTITCKTT